LKEVKPGQPNFITEAFFSNSGAHHVGYIASMINLKNLGKDLTDMERHIERLQQERERHLQV